MKRTPGCRQIQAMPFRGANQYLSKRSGAKKPGRCKRFNINQLSPYKTLALEPVFIVEPLYQPLLKRNFIFGKVSAINNFS